MATRAITALFDDYDEAAAAVDRVEAEGVPHGDISIVAGNADARHSGRIAGGSGTTPAESATEGAGTGATLGTVLGGGAGLLAGLGLLAIPGVGPVVAAGWAVAAITGAGVGAATGGLLGALTGAGLSEADAEAYAEGVRRGGTLVSVKADEALAGRVTDVLKHGGCVDLDARAEDWRAQGWTGPARPAGQSVEKPEIGTPIPEAAPARGEISSTAIGAAASTTTGLDTGSDAVLLPTGEPRLAPDPDAAPPTKPIPGGIR